MPQFSFDIVSRLDLQEIDNAVNQAMKEVRTRFDFKGTKCAVELNREEKKLKLLADDDMKLRNLQEILKLRIAARQISQKALRFEDPEKSFEGTVRQEVVLVQGIPQEDAKIIVKTIKSAGLKVQAAIQEDEIRVSSKSKDELQSVMQLLKATTLKVPLQFTNYR